VDTPRRIYGDPEDMVVAYQLGAPAINFLPAERLGLAVPEVARIGVRPEDVGLARDSTPSDAPLPDLPAQVTQVERLGAEDVALFDWQGQVLRALLPPGIALTPGEAVQLRLAADKLLLFDARGARVRRPPDQSCYQGDIQATQNSMGVRHVI